jgi:hypothetical protein
MDLCCIDEAIQNIYLQNEYLSIIINNGLILPPDTTTKSNITTESQRLMCFKRAISNLKNNAKKCNRDIHITITAKELNDLYLKQKGKCVFTKKDLTFVYENETKKYNSSLNVVKKIKHINDFNICINRIDNNKPYNYENVQLIACRINLMKNNLSNDNFFKLLNCVVKNCNICEINK